MRKETKILNIQSCEIFKLEMSTHIIREHYLELTSSRAWDDYCIKIPSNFKTYLQRPIPLGEGENWVCGLSEVMLGKNHKEPKVIGAEEEHSESYNSYNVITSCVGEHAFFRNEMQHNDDDQFTFVMVYTNVIEERRVGSRRTRSLRSFLKKNDERMEKEFKNIHYFPVAMTGHVTEISIMFADCTGAPLKFHPSRDPLKAVLHFKRLD